MKGQKEKEKYNSSWLDNHLIDNRQSKIRKKSVLHDLKIVHLWIIPRLELTRGKQGNSPKGYC